MTANTPKDKLPQPRTGLRRLGLHLVLRLGWLLGGAGLALSALWWWAGTPGSLASTLNLAAQLMPASQRLSTDQVEGSLRYGGQVGVEVQAARYVRFAIGTSLHAVTAHALVLVRAKTRSTMPLSERSTKGLSALPRQP